MIATPSKHIFQQASGAFVSCNLHDAIPHFITMYSLLNGILDAVCVAKDNELNQLKGTYKDHVKINTIVVKPAL